MDFSLGEKVLFNGRLCVVTNACIARGKYIEVSPIGVDKYYIVSCQSNAVKKVNHK